VSALCRPCIPARLNPRARELQAPISPLTPLTREPTFPAASLRPVSFPTAATSVSCRHSLAVAQGLIATGKLTLGAFDVTRLFHPMWLREQHTAEAYAGARLRLSTFRPTRRREPSGAAPTETRAERVQALVSEARVTAHAVADDPRLTLLLRNALASLYREGSGLSTDEFGRVELVVPLAGTTERARQAAGVGGAEHARGRGRGLGRGGRGVMNPRTSSGPGRGRSARYLSSGEAPPAAKRSRGGGRGGGRGGRGGRGAGQTSE
jgi:hypothetical protein